MRINRYYGVYARNRRPQASGMDHEWFHEQSLDTKADADEEKHSLKLRGYQVRIMRDDGTVGGIAENLRILKYS